MGNILRLLHPHLGKPSLQLYSVCRHRVLPNTAQQYVRHHPDAGIGTDFCLLPADIRLPQPTHAVCGRLGSRLLPGGTVFLFKSYQQARPTGSLFHAFVFIGLGSLLFPQLILFVPIFWIGAYNFQSLQPKSFFASLVGWSVPYWLLLGHALYYGQMELFCQPFRELVTFAPTRFDYQPWELATLGYLLVLFIVSAAHCLIAGYEDKIRTRSYLHFLILLNFCIFVYIGLQPVLSVHLMSFLLIGVSILAGHLFVLTNSRSSNIFFICAFIGLFILLGFNIWTLL